MTQVDDGLVVPEDQGCFTLTIGGLTYNLTLYYVEAIATTNTFECTPALSGIPEGNSDGVPQGEWSGNALTNTITLSYSDSSSILFSTDLVVLENIDIPAFSSPFDGLGSCSGIATCDLPQMSGTWEYLPVPAGNNGGDDDGSDGGDDDGSVSVIYG